MCLFPILQSHGKKNINSHKQIKDINVADSPSGKTRFSDTLVQAKPINLQHSDERKPKTVYHHRSEKCSTFCSLLRFNVVAMERIRYNFRPLLPVEGEE